jgi:hypothetical protein
VHRLTILRTSSFIIQEVVNPAKVWVHQVLIPAYILKNTADDQVTGAINKTTLMPKNKEGKKRAICQNEIAILPSAQGAASTTFCCP